MQRALLQFKRREKQPLVRKALRAAGREDLIGFGKKCLVPPEEKPKRYGGKKLNNRMKGVKKK